jgi:hypothetical protein
MIKIRINEIEREMELRTIDESWINQQINRRRADGIEVCVRIAIKIGDLDMLLSTPSNEPRGSSGRPPRQHELMVFDLWDKQGLNDINFTGGKIISFLKQLGQIM